MKILVVDDDEIDLKAAVRALKAKWPDATYITARSGSRAIEMIDDCEDIDFAVLDLKLGVVTGGQIAQILKRRGVPSILLTGSKGLEPKQFPVLTKKTGLPDLVDSVLSHLGLAPSPAL
ncbi:MAG: response regulator [Bradymonadia bacterium]